MSNLTPEQIAKHCAPVEANARLLKAAREMLEHLIEMDCIGKERPPHNCAANEWRDAIAAASSTSPRPLHAELEALLGWIKPDGPDESAEQRAAKAAAVAAAYDALRGWTATATMEKELAEALMETLAEYPAEHFNPQCACKYCALLARHDAAQKEKGPQ